MNRMLILEAWNSYRAQVIPRDAPVVQVSESRRAFFAGAGSVWSLFTSQQTGAPLVVSVNSQILEDIDAELRQFLAKVKAGVK
jgi:hypothetical protein